MQMRLVVTVDINILSMFWVNFKSLTITNHDTIREEPPPINVKKKRREKAVTKK